MNNLDYNQSLWPTTGHKNWIWKGVHSEHMTCIVSYLVVGNVTVHSASLIVKCVWLNGNRVHIFWILYYIVCRWTDKFCLHCNIFIYIRHIWIKPVLCSRMVSLFHHTSPWTHRCLQSSPIAYGNGRVFRRSVQTARCYWILIRGKSSSNWNSQTNASRLWWSVWWCEYSKTMGKVKCVDVSTVRRWVRWSVLMWVQ